MIALLLSWCLAFPAYHEPVSDVYFFSGDFAARTDGARLWASQPISATATYSDTADTATLSLFQSLAFRNQDGALSSQSDHFYTLYVCSADARPYAVWIPLMQ